MTGEHGAHVGIRECFASIPTGVGVRNSQDRIRVSGISIWTRPELVLGDSLRCSIGVRAMVLELQHAWIHGPSP